MRPREREIKEPTNRLMRRFAAKGAALGLALAGTFNALPAANPTENEPQWGGCQGGPLCSSCKAELARGMDGVTPLQFTSVSPVAHAVAIAQSSPPAKTSVEAPISLSEIQQKPDCGLHKYLGTRIQYVPVNSLSSPPSQEALADLPTPLDTSPITSNGEEPPEKSLLRPTDKTRKAFPSEANSKALGSEPPVSCDDAGKNPPTPSTTPLPPLNRMCWKPRQPADETAPTAVEEATVDGSIDDARKGEGELKGDEREEGAGKEKKEEENKQKAKWRRGSKNDGQALRELMLMFTDVRLLDSKIDSEQTPQAFWRRYEPLLSLAATGTFINHLPEAKRREIKSRLAMACSCLEGVECKAVEASDWSIEQRRYKLENNAAQGKTGLFVAMFRHILDLIYGREALEKAMLAGREKHRVQELLKEYGVYEDVPLADADELIQELSVTQRKFAGCHFDPEDENSWPDVNNQENADEEQQQQKDRIVRSFLQRKRSISK